MKGTFTIAPDGKSVYKDGENEINLPLADDEFIVLIDNTDDHLIVDSNKRKWRVEACPKENCTWWYKEIN